MRGKDIKQAFFDLLNGITPAYAGKSFIIDCPLQAGRDHPRLCGEKHRGISDLDKAMGSPPPMRGKDRILKYHKDGVGITPAYAGKSLWSKEA